MRHECNIYPPPPLPPPQGKKGKKKKHAILHPSFFSFPGKKSREGRRKFSLDSAPNPDPTLHRSR